MKAQEPANPKEVMYGGKPYRILHNLSQWSPNRDIGYIWRLLVEPGTFEFCARPIPLPLRSGHRPGSEFAHLLPCEIQKETNTDGQYEAVFLSTTVRSGSTELPSKTDRPGRVVLGIVPLSGTQVLRAHNSPEERQWVHPKDKPMSKDEQARAIEQGVQNAVTEKLLHLADDNRKALIAVIRQHKNSSDQERKAALLKAEGMSLADIASRLPRNGKTGKPYTRQGVAKMLKRVEVK